MTRSAAYVFSAASNAAPRSTGKERDAESGNDYMFARYYNSATGRFLSPDWSAKEDPVPYAKLDNPQSLNLYSYVYNNPLGRADADGHCPWCLALAGGGTLEAEAPLAALGPVGWGVIGVTAVGVLGVAAYEHFHQEAAAPAPAPAETPTAPAAAPAAPTAPAATPAAPAPTVAQPNPGGQIMVGPSGTAVVIPPGQAARPADNGKGVVIGPPATVGTSNADTTRIMDPTASQPTGYVRKYNEHGQPIDPSTGKPGPNDKTHTPL